MFQSSVTQISSIHTYGLLLRRLFIPLILDVREIYWLHYFYLSNLSEHLYSSVYSYPPLHRSSLAPPFIAPSLRSSAIHSSTASPVLLRRLFYPFDSWCSRDWIHYIWLNSLYLIDWIHSVISILITSLGTSLFLRLFLPPRLRRLLPFLRRSCPTSILSFY
jgi:hypothetical protein